MATFKKGRRKTFDLAILNVVAVMKHDGFHVQDFTALIGGSCGKSGESMEKLAVPTEFLSLIKPGDELPIKWTAEMADALTFSEEDNYKRIMTEYFFKSFLAHETQETETKTMKTLQRTFQCYNTTGDEVKNISSNLILFTK